MKIFRVKFDGARAILAVAVEANGQWFKKELSASDGQELWEGLEALSRLDSMSVETKTQAGEYISKAKEHEALEIAIPAWLQKGNKIKVFPMVGEKKMLTQEERDEILLDLGFELEPQDESFTRVAL